MSFPYQIRAAAVLSDDRLYRYSLTRRWDVGPLLPWVMLNPSTATAETDDTTVIRVRNFTHRWGYPGFEIVNLYGLRSPKPTALWSAEDPIGPDNDRHLVEAVRNADRVVVAWGTHAPAERVQRVVDILGAWRMYCLGTTKAGAPRHPLYLVGSSELERWVRPL